MKNKSEFRGRCLRAPLLVAVVVLTGCQMTQQVDPGMTTSKAVFVEQIGMAATAINVGDLETARDYLGEARGVAVTAREAQKVDSLDHLIVGAEALRVGDPAGARAAWSQIDDPRLAREVRHKARLIGVEVPMVPVDEGATR